MQAPLIAAIVVTAAFVALAFEATIAVRRQEQIEHYRRLLARADRVRTYRRAASKVQVAHRRANNFHAVQHLVGDDSAATQLARDTYLEAAWDAPVATPHPHPHIGADGKPRPCTHPEICAADEAEFTREGDLR